MSDFLKLIGTHSSLLQIVVGGWVAGVATLALSTWRKQLLADKQLSFVDDLADTVHEFILLMGTPTHRLRFAKIGIDAHKGAAFGFEQYENAEAIAFINKDGPGTRDKILADLEAVRPVVGKMQSLAVKGQVLRLPDYQKCQNACRMLAWSYGQLEAFCAIIGNPNLNWDHPVVQGSLNKLHEIDADRIDANLREQNIEFIAFAKKAYEVAIR